MLNIMPNFGKGDICHQNLNQKILKLIYHVAGIMSEFRILGTDFLLKSQSPNPEFRNNPENFNQNEFYKEPVSVQYQ